MSVLVAGIEEGFVISDVVREMARQRELWNVQHHPDGTSFTAWFKFAEQRKKLNDENVVNGTPNWTSILLEEVYEALSETDPALLRAELVQVAAVCGSWIADIDGRNK